MTVAAGLDIAAIVSQQAAASTAPGSTAQSPASASGPRRSRSFGAQPAAMAADASFRAGFQALLPSAGETPTAIGTREKSIANNTTSKQSFVSVPVQNTLVPAQPQLLATDHAAVKSTASLHPVKTPRAPRIPPGEAKAQAKNDTSPSHSPHRFSAPAAARTTSPQQTTPQPTAAHAVSGPAAVPIPKVTVPANISAQFPMATSHAIPAEGTPSAVAAISTPIHANTQKQTGAAAHTPASPETQERSLSADLASSAPVEHGAGMQSPKDITSSPVEESASLSAAPSVASSPAHPPATREAAGKPLNHAVPAVDPTADAQETSSAPIAANGSLKLRETPLRHESSPAAEQQSSSNFSVPQLHPSLVRDPAGVQSLSANHGVTSTVHDATPETRDAFAVLDSAPDSASALASGQSQATWLHAGTRHAEAGFLDPSLGWVSVRADVTPAGLHAAVIPSSPEAAQTLSHHLAGLNAYLAENHGRTITATVATPEPAPQNTHSGSGHNQQQGSAHSGNSSGDSRTPQPPFSLAPTAQTSPTSALSVFEPATLTPTRPGGISVVA